MLRRTSLACSYRASLELDRIRSMLRGRARLERKVGLKRLFFLMRTQTRYRVEQQSHWNRAIVRKNVDSAAREHGTGWAQLRNEFGRQNILLLPRSQQMLAQYEPLAFRAVVELCASRIPPPPPPVFTKVPEEAYMPRSNNPQESHPAARVELRRGVERVLQCGPSKLREAVHGDADRLMEAWKEFDVAAGGGKK
ncbi:hypothetical protein C3747_76g227 [Trypanosoma cruzi]|uniref:Uncharacterized protein n=2 Tax=Trypanosoma cruzi TaxID=5693 RepID=Q4DD82_TRYCC|nr:hypothetical protein, conserved [Trypanosoma cruzi]PBJ75067.1 hypothetical protein BCY84_11786 [Trypanosoma cruzi cruzi]EAN90473.1 hypothetical protein, conserved [Trypanosoma cruzi]PWU92002.1 hypothetical protein C4B63_40g37 [Trypanosoma cruzi]PWV09643.1 hypothetical protein C3747_76g227 [Trypanosoma cruzi]RNC48346.1 hypothetical protein TcCL_NonESM01762 [Trypanosoma cruzi]|eukprot:XP_812324.1 hypothetical protein [Trypanosoma cruzi strain CL Brener]